MILSECPYCDVRPELKTTESYWHIVECPECSLTTVPNIFRRDAGKEWNKSVKEIRRQLFWKALTDNLLKFLRRK